MGIADGITDWDLLMRVDAILDDGNLETEAFVMHSLDTIGSGSLAGLRLLIE